MEKVDKVIAGLECCTERRCTKCPYLGQEMYCMSVLEKDALDVINGLRLRCSRLEAERDAAREKLSWLEPKTAPNDWGEYPPEFPREGM